MKPGTTNGRPTAGIRSGQVAPSHKKPAAIAPIGGSTIAVRSRANARRASRVGIRRIRIVWAHGVSEDGARPTRTGSRPETAIGGSQQPEQDHAGRSSRSAQAIDRPERPAPVHAPDDQQAGEVARRSADAQQQPERRRAAEEDVADVERDHDGHDPAGDVDRHCRRAVIATIGAEPEDEPDGRAEALLRCATGTARQASSAPSAGLAGASPLPHLVAWRAGEATNTKLRQRVDREHERRADERDQRRPATPGPISPDRLNGSDSIAFAVISSSPRTSRVIEAGDAHCARHERRRP